MKVKDSIIMTLLVAIIVMAVAITCRVEHDYEMNGYVDKITADSVVVVDQTGNIWEYVFDEKINESSFKEHESVVISFNDNCSDSKRQDDIITDIKKA